MKNSEKIDLLLREVQRLRDDVAQIRRVELVPYIPPVAPWPQPPWFVSWQPQDAWVGDSVEIDMTRFSSPYVHTDTAGGINTGG